LNCFNFFFSCSSFNFLTLSSFFSAFPTYKVLFGAEIPSITLPFKLSIESFALCGFSKLIKPNCLDFPSLSTVIKQLVTLP